MREDIANIRRAIRDIPNFPKPGIVFKDITPLLANGPLFAKTIDCFAERYQGQKIDTVLGIESRGFIIGAALAYRVGRRFQRRAQAGKITLRNAQGELRTGIRYGCPGNSYRRDQAQVRE